jgi:hypothetical protein
MKAVSFQVVLLLKTMARRCIQSLGGVSMTDSEGLGLSSYAVPLT